MNDTDIFSLLRELTREQIEKRIADLDAERAQLMLILRSIVARESTRRKAQPRPESKA